MFYLCTIEGTDLQTVFGNYSSVPEYSIPPKYQNLFALSIGQKPDCSSFLIFSNQVVEELTQHNSVPEGYDFTFRQEWGLNITEEKLHRMIATLRAEAYPPMVDYLDAKVKGDAEQEAEYIAKCLAVKAKYPKFSF
jgi:hypothetical protein